MPLLDYEERTERPTPRRRLEARRQGRVPRSRDLSAVGRLLVAVAAVSLFAGGLLQWSGGAIQAAIVNAEVRSSEPDTANVGRIASPSYSVRVASGAAGNLVPPALMLLGGVILVNLLQTGFVFAAGIIRPEMARVSPVTGLARLFSAETLVALASRLVTVAVVVLASSAFLVSALPEVSRLVHAEPATVLQTIGRTALSLALQLAAAMLALALIEFAWQKWRYEASLRMSPRELREELKESAPAAERTLLAKRT